MQIFYFVVYYWYPIFEVPLMKHLKKFLPIALGLLLLPGLILPARAADKASVSHYVQEMIQYYRHHQSAAKADIQYLLNQITAADPRQGEAWTAIMKDWAWVNEEMDIYEKALPDGLPQDDSLCIVVMGYDLKDDGTMREELIDRLVVALTSALKYPNAYVAVTGGETADVPGFTEAGQMAAWLKEKGLAENRLILESKSLSTTDNAQNLCKLLQADYPQITSLAVVTSDYHVRLGCTAFLTAANYEKYYNGEEFPALVGNAVCTTDRSDDTMYTQAWGISILTDFPFSDRPAPALTLQEETQPAQTIPSATAADAPTEEKKTQSPVPILVLILLAAALYVAMPKKPKKKRQRPKMNWNDTE